jgi:hypothetical protein
MITLLTIVSWPIGLLPAIHHCGTVIVSFGSGLISTLTSTSVTAAWVGCQIISGIGRGFTVQTVNLLLSTSIALLIMSPPPPPKAHSRHTEQPLTPRDPRGMSLLMFSQNFGAALFISFAQTICSNTLDYELRITAPGVDIQVIINAGASSFRTVVSKARLPGVLLAYDRAISCVFYLAAGAERVLLFVGG